MKENAMSKQTSEIVIRPYELVEIVVRLGTDDVRPENDDARWSRILRAIEDNPRIRVRLQYYQGKQYTGSNADAPFGVAQTLLWEMEIMRLFRRKPEAVMPERAVTGYAVLETIAGIGIELFYPASASPAWTGYPGLIEQDFRRGQKKIKDLLKKLLPCKFRSHEELDRVRRTTAAEIDSADCFRLFPQHILFVMSYYGVCSEILRGRHYQQDSMYEVGAAIRRYPDRPIMLVPEDCMLCPTCSGYDPGGIGWCGVTPDDAKPVENTLANRVNLGLMRTLGLEYYQKTPAVELVKRVFERMEPDHLSFTYDGSPPSVWSYLRARWAGMGFLDAYENPQGVITRARGLLDHDDVQTILPETDKKHMASTLEKAENSHDARDRYLNLVNEPFTYLWKFYLEKIVREFARLPSEVTRQRLEREASRSFHPDHVSPWYLEDNQEANAFPRQPVVTAEPLTSDDDVLDAVARRWRTGTYSTGFTTVGQRPAIAETAIKVNSGRDRLYFTVLCADRHPHEIKASVRIGAELVKHKSPWRSCCGDLDDYVSIVLNAVDEPLVCYQFSFNARGVKAAKVVKLGKYNKIGEEWLYETDWAVTTSVEPKLWRGTVEVPFSCLSSKIRGDGTCRLNVARLFRNEALQSHLWATPHRNWWDLDMHLYQLGRFGWLEGL